MIMEIPSPSPDSQDSSPDVSTTINEDTVSKLRQWILDAKPQTIEIGLDTDLINEGALDSLQMVNFLLFIEEMRRKEIPESLIQTQYFTSIRVINETFFKD